MKVNEFLQEMVRQKYSPVSVLGSDNKLINEVIFNNNFPDEVINDSDSDIIFNMNLMFHRYINSYYSDIIASNHYSHIPAWMWQKQGWEITRKALEKAGLSNFIGKKPFPNDIDDIIGKWKNYYKNKELKNALETIKAKKINLVVVGYGGAMQNIMYNLYGMCKALDIRGLFNIVDVWEEKNISLSNLLRVPEYLMEREYSKSQYKKKYIESKVACVLPKTEIFLGKEELLSKEAYLIDEYLSEEDVKEYDLENTLFIGAPDLTTRNLLDSLGAHFIMVGHADNEIGIKKNPAPSQLAVETYGTIDIPVLITNLLIGTYKIIDILSKREYQEIPSKEELFSFSLTPEIARELTGTEENAANGE